MQRNNSKTMKTEPSGKAKLKNQKREKLLINLATE